MKFRNHKHEVTKSSGHGINATWSVVGPNGAIRFSVYGIDGDYEETCFLDVHRMEGDGAPDHLNCELTGGRCWHDGTSLYAKTLWDSCGLREAYNEARHNDIWWQLEHEYWVRFEGGNE